MHPRRVAAVAAGVAAVVVGLAGCGGAGGEDRPRNVREPDPRGPKQLLLIASEFEFDAPKTAEAGLTEVRLVNIGDELHQAALVRLENGVTADTFVDTLEADIAAASELGTFVGGPAAVGPDAATSVLVDLDAGNYVVLCLIPSPSDGRPHVMKGMESELDVIAPESVLPEQEPPHVGTIRLHDFSFELPDRYNGGPIDVLNVGTQAHELVIGRLHEGADLDDVAAALTPLFQPATTPLPFDPVGGTAPISPGERVHLEIHLPPGRYAFLCLMPDEQDVTVDHLQRGMGIIVTVS